MGDAETLGILVVVVTLVGAVFAVISLFGLGEVWNQVGANGLTPREPTRGEPGMRPVAFDEEEARQLIAGRNAVRARRGLRPIDPDEEVARIRDAREADGPDPEVEAEVRGLVRRRNARLARRGEAPLDEDAEVRRRLAELP